MQIINVRSLKTIITVSVLVKNYIFFRTSCFVFFALGIETLKIKEKIQMIIRMGLNSVIVFNNKLV